MSNSTIFWTVKMRFIRDFDENKKPSPLGRVPPKGAGEVRYHVPIYWYPAANPNCGNTSSVFFIALGGDEKSTFPKGEGFCSKNKNRPLGRFYYCL